MPLPGPLSPSTWFNTSVSALDNVSLTSMKCQNRVAICPNEIPDLWASSRIFARRNSDNADPPRKVRMVAMKQAVDESNHFT